MMKKGIRFEIGIKNRKNPNYDFWKAGDKMKQPGLELIRCRKKAQCAIKLFLHIAHLATTVWHCASTSKHHMRTAVEEQLEHPGSTKLMACQTYIAKCSGRADNDNLVSDRIKLWQAITQFASSVFVSLISKHWSTS